MTKKYLLVCILSLTFLLSSCVKKVSNNNIDGGSHDKTSSEDVQDMSNVPKKIVGSQDKTVMEPPINQEEPKDTPIKEDPKPIEPPVKPTTPPSNTNPSALSNTEKSWYYTPNSKNMVPSIPKSIKTLIDKYSGYYVGSSSKVIYLTFDEGYENGYTSKILDVLKENNVTACFFVTRPYINKNPELIKRMVQEGHVVGNHSSTHPSMPSKAGDVDAFKKEFLDTEKAFEDVTGTKMPKFFRPPMGKYSEKSLNLTQSLGYKTIFWSFAHKDWLVDNQPTVEDAKKRILSNAHNGEIMLLHAVSKTNTEVLDSVIKNLKSKGYSFASLKELK